MASKQTINRDRNYDHVTLIQTSTPLECELVKSGLDKADMGVYLAQETELSAVGLKPHLYLENPLKRDGEPLPSPGYVIPYYDIRGQRVPFYRVKLFNPLPKGPKHLQPVNSGAWIYFPPQFAERLKEVINNSSQHKVIILTEEEEKAAKACKEGFAACAVTGFDNWHNNTLVLPPDTKIVRSSSGLAVRLPPGYRNEPCINNKTFLAIGLKDLADVIHKYDLTLAIAFDAKDPADIQREIAIAELAFEFRSRGIATNKIIGLKLPVAKNSVTSLDTLLKEHGAPLLNKVIQAHLNLRNAYPRHPNLKAFIAKNLNDGTLPRQVAKQLALLLLSDMDCEGTRLIQLQTSEPYFFDERSRVLMRVSLMHHNQEPLHELAFGRFLYNRYDIGQADHTLLKWLAASFTGEAPVDIVDPRSVMALIPGDRLAFQLSDGRFAMISGNPKAPIEICYNGSYKLMFRSDQVETIDDFELLKAFKAQLNWLQSTPKPSYNEMFWPATLSKMNFTGSGIREILSVLYYISPWLLRWRGTQLPIELLVGEPGSGKSTLCSLRLRILTGRPALRNQPTDIRDWYASITSQDGLHAIDNVHMVNKELRQRLSDELCRLVTEPEPTIEMRRLFTTSDNVRLPVRNVFVMTAVQQPFLNADILQRSIIAELEAVSNDFQAGWDTVMLEQFGGRVNWVAHQLAVLHLIFREVQQKWNPNYKSGHRLAHFEQLFYLAGTILGVPNLSSLIKSLAKTVDLQVSEYDWVMDGLKDFRANMLAIHSPDKQYTLHDIAVWAASKEDYENNGIITNARLLARYIKSHKAMVEKAIGLVEAGSRANRATYRLVYRPK